jgi:hypothetical protein
VLGESKTLNAPEEPSCEPSKVKKPLVFPRFVESLYIVKKLLPLAPALASKADVINTLLDADEGVIETDKVLDAVTKEVDDCTSFSRISSSYNLQNL